MNEDVIIDAINTGRKLAAKHPEDGHRASDFSAAIRALRALETRATAAEAEVARLELLITRVREER